MQRLCNEIRSRLEGKQHLLSPGSIRDLSDAHLEVCILSLGRSLVVAVVDAERVLLVSNAFGYRQETPSSNKQLTQRSAHETIVRKNYLDSYFRYKEQKGGGFFFRTKKEDNFDREHNFLQGME